MTDVTVDLGAFWCSEREIRGTSGSSENKNKTRCIEIALTSRGISDSSNRLEGRKGGIGVRHNWSGRT